MDGWIRTKDAAPPANQRVLAWGGSYIRIAFKDDLGQWRNNRGYPVNTHPTHWMPLPEKPKAR